jgi:CBS domain-containing protein
MAELTTLGQRYAETRLGDVRSRWDGTGVWAAATEDMNLADAMRRCLRIGADDMEGARGGEARSSPGSLMLRQCPHRFAVIDAGGMVTDVVAQSDVAMYLRRNRELLDPSVLDAPVKSLGLGAQGGRRVVSLSVSVPVIDCFYEMERSSVQAVAIVDDGTDVLVGNLSESDIATLRPDAFGAFALPVGEFLVHTHGITPIVPPAEDRAYSPQSTAYGVALAREGARLTVSCEDTATVGEVLELMHTRAVHRVWVVDDARRPVGVISLADVLAVVAADERAGCTDSTTKAKITGESESVAA